MIVPLSFVLIFVSKIAILELESEPESPLAPPVDPFHSLGHYEWNFHDHGKYALAGSQPGVYKSIPARK